MVKFINIKNEIYYFLIIQKIVNLHIKTIYKLINRISFLLDFKIVNYKRKIFAILILVIKI